MTRKRNNTFLALLIFFFLSCISLLEAQDLNGRIYSDERIMYTFHEHTVEIETWRSAGDGGTITKIVPYKVIEKHKVPFLCYGENYENEYLIMHNHILLYLYNSKEELEYVGIRLGTGVGVKHLNVVTGVRTGTKSSSFLQEGKISYHAQNIETPEIGRPWVEGSSGYGIDEWIEIKIEPYDPITILALMNGYVSYNKPYLYEQNSRIKKLEISGNDNSMLVDIPDSPNLYEIKIGPRFGDTLRLTIKDVYPGTRWSDTCLESIEVYPYWNLKD